MGHPVKVKVAKNSFNYPLWFMERRKILTWCSGGVSPWVSGFFPFFFVSLQRTIKRSFFDPFGMTNASVFVLCYNFDREWFFTTFPSQFSNKWRFIPDSWRSWRPSSSVYFLHNNYRLFFLYYLNKFKFEKVLNQLPWPKVHLVNENLLCIV